MNRRAACQILLAAGACSIFPIPVFAAEKRDIFTVLKTRRSVRQYSSEPVSEADIKTMLACAMLAPSAVNEQPWEFVVITDRAMLDQIAEEHKNAAMARNAPLAILLCLNQKKEKIKGMAILDMGMAAENLMLAAAGLGLGSVFTGVFPVEEKMAAFARLCQLPASVLPIGLIVIGHPKTEGAREVDRYNPEAVHMNKW